jgi:hypothetical protein
VALGVAGSSPVGRPIASILLVGWLSPMVACFSQRQTAECGALLARNGGDGMAYQITLTDEDYARLQTVSSESGKPIEMLVHEAITQQYAPRKTIGTLHHADR